MVNMAGAAAVVQARDLRRDYSFGKELVHALCGVSFDVPAGDYVAIVGPSGCGKSTLLKALAGVHRLDEGEITLHGQPFEQGSTRRDRKSVV